VNPDHLVEIEVDAVVDERRESEKLD